MNIDQLQTQDVQNIDTSTLLPDITSQLTETLAPMLLISVVLTIVFFVIYIASALRKRKVEKAILDIQKTLLEMNERDKSRMQSNAPTRPPRVDEDRIIASD